MLDVLLLGLFSGLVGPDDDGYEQLVGHDKDRYDWPDNTELEDLAGWDKSKDGQNETDS